MTAQAAGTGTGESLGRAEAGGGVRTLGGTERGRRAVPEVVRWSQPGDGPQGAK